MTATAPADLDWARAREHALAIVLLCGKAAFHAPEEVGQHRAKLAAACDLMAALARCLRLHVTSTDAVIAAEDAREAAMSDVADMLGMVEDDDEAGVAAEIERLRAAECALIDELVDRDLALAEERSRLECIATHITGAVSEDGEVGTYSAVAPALAAAWRVLAEDEHSATVRHLAGQARAGGILADWPVAAETIPDDAGLRLVWRARVFLGDARCADIYGAELRRLEVEERRRTKERR